MYTDLGSRCSERSECSGGPQSIKSEATKANKTEAQNLGGVVGSEAEEGVAAYQTEYKMTMTMLLTLTLSFVSMFHVFTMLLTVTCSCSPVELFVVLGPWVCLSLLFMGADHHLTAIVGGFHCCWAVYVVYWVLAIICCLLSSWHVVVNWVVVVFFGHPGLLSWWVSCDMAACDMEGTLIVIDPSDMGI